MSDIIEKLVATFIRFPGIGPRQARRFIYHLLAQNSLTIENLAQDLLTLKQTVNQCRSCCRFFIVNNRAAAKEICELCLDESRDPSILMIVEKDSDLEVVRKSGHYSGQFFVLGGLVPILEEAPAKKIRLNPLLEKIKATKNQLKEIIIALAANPEGDNTGEYLQRALAPLGIKITILGRGLSTGTELEYSDAETLRNALKNRA
ncbi:MAG: recombination mediator RecR [Patescibacteria group bacterium]